MMQHSCRRADLAVEQSGNSLPIFNLPRHEISTNALESTVECSMDVDAAGDGVRVNRTD
jgi:hypothetical protein